MSLPSGVPFTRAYRDKGPASKDSQQFRIRLSQYAKDHFGQNAAKLRSRIARDGGIQAPPRNSDLWSLVGLIESNPIDELLDAITYIHRALADTRMSVGTEVTLKEVPSPRQQAWRNFVDLSMREENLGFRVDDECGVHFFVDAAYLQVNAATISALARPSFSGALNAFQTAEKHMDAQPPNTKDAVRSVFESVEILARLIVPAAQNLNSKMVRGPLRAACLAVAPSDVIEQKVTDMLFESLATWVDPLHNYRHGQGLPDPVAPSEELAVLVMSTGAAYARQLAHFAVKLGK